MNFHPVKNAGPGRTMEPGPAPDVAGQKHAQ